MADITAEQFEAATGYAPEHDDLERSNCDKAGQMFHTQCGWDHARNLPEFIASAYRFKELLDAGKATDILSVNYSGITVSGSDAAKRAVFFRDGAMYIYDGTENVESQIDDAIR